jgi:hypothetical protein
MKTPWMTTAAAVALTLACSKPGDTHDDVQRAPVPPPAPAAPSASSLVGTANGGGAGQGGGAGAAGNAKPLAVVIAGRPPGLWTPDALGAVTRFTIHADGADKDVWSLREVARQLVGPYARITGAVDGDGTHAKITRKDWADAKKTPVLRINRRGMYKIQWVDRNGDVTNDDDVRDVRTIEVEAGD